MKGMSRSTKYLLVIYQDEMDDSGPVTCVAVFDLETGERVQSMPSDIPEMQGLDAYNLHDLADGVMEYCGSYDPAELAQMLVAQKGFMCAISHVGIDTMRADIRGLLNVSEELTPLEQLNAELRSAVECEDYERAAELRDQIAKLHNK